VTYFHFDIGERARHAGRFIGRVRGELLRALIERKSEIGFSQQGLARKLDTERALINRQLSGEASLSLRSLADLAWAMDMEISFELKKPHPKAGQNQPMTTSTVSHGQIKYINGATKRDSVRALPANSDREQPKKSA
jgi:transcriptional regulator with XRE-family HTH domain